MFDLKPKLKNLSFSKQVAFAARCAERVRHEIASIPKDDYEGDSQLLQILHIAWQAAGGQAYDRAQVDDLLKEIENLCPLDEDTDEFVASMVSAVEQVGLLLIKSGNPARLCENAGLRMIDLLPLIYEEIDAMQASEVTWQREAVARLAAVPDDTVDRNTLIDLPEYPRSIRL